MTKAPESKASFARRIIGSTFLLGAAATAHSQQLAFPEAEGYGKYATGGRGGAVYEVTTLNPTGPGSLGAAISASGRRTVVFRVGGTITGNFTIANGNITIAGQTAPGGGICIKGTLNVNANDVIVRYIRVRLDTTVNPTWDTVAGRGRQNIILDHVSASWSGDEVMSLYLNKNVTIQWSMITEAAAKFVNGQNTGHQFGGIWGNEYGTYHHNLIAHNASRNPRWASGAKWNDFRNNVLYNWDYQSVYGGELYGDATWNFFTVNMIGNYYKYGPATNSGVRDRIAQPSARSSTDKGSWYVSGNYVDGYPAVTADNWLGVDGSNYIRLNAPWPAMPIRQQSPAAAYEAVLAHVGASKPRRDSVDARIINEVRNRTATYGNNGIINRASDVGGWPTLANGTPPADSDHDGMPNAWETLHGLNPNEPSDRNGDRDGDGYTNLEEYLNELGAFGTPPSNAGDEIVWSAVRNIGGDSDVSTEGTLVRAVNLTRSGGSYDADVTVNGVTFVRAPHSGTTTTLANGDTLITSDSERVGAYEGFGGSTAPFSSLSANYQNLLRSGHYNDGDCASSAATGQITLRLRNLEIGRQYQLQVWGSDYRAVNLGQTNPDLATAVRDSASGVVVEHNVHNALGGMGQHVIGTFIATDTTKAITLIGGNSGTDTSVPNCAAIWNAYQLRRLGS